MYTPLPSKNLVQMADGTARFPLASLGNGAGAEAHITENADGLYELVTNGGDGDVFAPTSSWFREEVEALRALPLPRN